MKSKERLNDQYIIKRDGKSQGSLVKIKILMGRINSFDAAPNYLTFDPWIWKK